MLLGGAVLLELFEVVDEGLEGVAEGVDHGVGVFEEPDLGLQGGELVGVLEVEVVDERPELGGEVLGVGGGGREEGGEGLGALAGELLVERGLAEALLGWPLEVVGQVDGVLHSLDVFGPALACQRHLA